MISMPQPSNVFQVQEWPKGHQFALHALWLLVFFDWLVGQMNIFL
jgi:hypothetical protein